MTNTPDAPQYAGDLAEEDVLAFLEAHPDFLVKHPKLFRTLTPPARELGEGVSDMQQAMIKQLRRDVEQTEDLARLLIDTSRDNLSTQSRIHECVLRLLDAKSFEELIDIVTSDFSVWLDMDAVTLCIEAGEAATFPVKALTLLQPGTVDFIMGRDRDTRMRAEIEGEAEIYGEAAPLIRSDALVRLRISKATPPAMLCFGSRDPDAFSPNHGTELVQFLSKALEKLIRIWLDLPAD